MHTITPFTVLFLFDTSSDEEVLLLERSQEKGLFPGLYTGIGGHVDIRDGEHDIWNGMQREFQEETKISWDAVREKRMIAQVSRREGNESILLFVFSGKIEKERVSLSCTEGDLHWVKKTNMLSLPLIPTSRLILKHFFLVGNQLKENEMYFSIVNNDYTELLAFPH